MVIDVPTWPEVADRLEITGTPSWVMGKAMPEIVKVPERSVVKVFSATLKVTVFEPTPSLAEVIWTQGTLLTAYQEQFDAVVMLTLPLPPAPTNAALPGDSVYVHPTLGTKNWRSRAWIKTSRTLSLVVAAKWESDLEIT